MGGPVVAGCVLQGVLGSIHLCRDALLESRCRGRIHAAEERRSHGRAAELAVLDGINPGCHPAAADEGFVCLGLKLGRVLDSVIVQPDVRDVKLGEAPLSPSPGAGFQVIPSRTAWPPS